MLNISSDNWNKWTGYKKTCGLDAIQEFVKSNISTWEDQCKTSEIPSVYITAKDTGIQEYVLQGEGACRLKIEYIQGGTVYLHTSKIVRQDTEKTAYLSIKSDGSLCVRIRSKKRDEKPNDSLQAQYEQLKPVSNAEGIERVERFSSYLRDKGIRQHGILRYYPSSLNDILKEKRVLSIEEVDLIATKTLKGLQALHHNNLMAGDICDENIFIELDPQGRVIDAVLANLETGTGSDGIIGCMIKDLTNYLNTMDELYSKNGYKGPALLEKLQGKVHYNDPTQSEVWNLVEKFLKTGKSFSSWTPEDTST